MMRFLVGFLVFCGIGCGSFRNTDVPGTWRQAEVDFVPISDSLAADPEMEALVAPYEQLYDRLTREVVGQASGPLEKDSPEGTLDRMSADALLYAARQQTPLPLDFAVGNSGGLRVPLAAGPLTIGRLYELMPFENWVVVLELSSAQVDSLVQQIARIGGEPVAGLTFEIEAATRTARNLRIGGQPLEAGRTYFVATHNYLADGGGGMPALWEPRARHNLDLLLRDAFITYVRDRGTLDPPTDVRISRIE